MNLLFYLQRCWGYYYPGSSYVAYRTHCARYTIEIALNNKDACIGPDGNSTEKTLGNGSRVKSNRMVSGTPGNGKSNIYSCKFYIHC